MSDIGPSGAPVVKSERRGSKRCVRAHDLSLVVRKPVFAVSDQVRHQPSCTATEDG